MTAAAPRRTLLQSVQRACSLLALLAEKRRPMTAREIAAELRINHTTSYHLLNTLVHEGFLTRDGERRYQLGDRLASIAESRNGAFEPDATLLAGLDELNLLTGETAYVGVWRGDEVVSVAVREGRRGVRVTSIALGYREHAHARALARALLAHRDEEFLDRFFATAPLEQLTPYTTTDPDQLRRLLSDARLVGVVTEREEFMLGVCCIGAPVIGPSGQPIGALSISMPKARFEADGPVLAETVRDVARRTSMKLLEEEDR